MTDAGARAFTNVSICAVTAFAVYWTSSPWCMLGMLFISYPGTAKKEEKAEDWP